MNGVFTIRLGAPWRQGLYPPSPRPGTTPSPKLLARPCTCRHSRDWLLSTSFGWQETGNKSFFLSWTLVSSSDIRCCFFTSFFSKAQLGPRLPKKPCGFVGRESFDIFSWMRCWGICCCLHLEGTMLSISGVLHSQLVVTVMLDRASGESETWVVDSEVVSTEEKG